MSNAKPKEVMCYASPSSMAVVRVPSRVVTGRTTVVLDKAAASREDSRTRTQSPGWCRLTLVGEWTAPCTRPMIALKDASTLKVMTSDFECELPQPIVPTSAALDQTRPLAPTKLVPPSSPAPPDAGQGLVYNRRNHDAHRR